MSEEVRLDDLAKDYLAMGIIEEDNLDELSNCVHCDATVMPWYLQCEGCGKNPHKADPPPTWLCSTCTDEHESENDANRCFLSHLPIPHWHIRVVMDSGYATDPISMFTIKGVADKFLQDIIADDSTFEDGWVEECDRDDKWECKTEHTHEWFTGPAYYDHGHLDERERQEAEDKTFEIREQWLDQVMS